MEMSSMKFNFRHCGGMVLRLGAMNDREMIIFIESLSNFAQLLMVLSFDEISLGFQFPMNDEDERKLWILNKICLAAV